MTAPTLLIGHRTRKNDNNVYILGAGFSADAGLPLITDFLNHMRDAADWLGETTAMTNVQRWKRSWSFATARPPLATGSM